MKNTIKIIGALSVLSIFFLLQACNSNNHSMNDKTETMDTMMHSSQMVDSEHTHYACPMHKNMTGNKGDKCSECGMDMKDMTYACPMHKDITGMEGDKCSECGMDMVEIDV